MKFAFFILLTVFAKPFEWQYNNIASRENAISSLLTVKPAEGDSSQSIRIINASELKRLPAVLRDLSAAISEPSFMDGLLLNRLSRSILLNDVLCNSFENPAYVYYQPGDTLYRVKLNRFNEQVTDRALAATLIHEIMHCVLLDIHTRARREDENAIAIVKSFGLDKNDSSGFFNNDFFVLMNSGNDGQHELIYQLFYPRMVSLLERFARIHKQPFFSHTEAEYLMWSGLQKTNAFAKLGEEEKNEIQQAILNAKGIYDDRFAGNGHY